MGIPHTGFMIGYPFETTDNINEFVLVDSTPETIEAHNKSASEEGMHGEYIYLDDQDTTYKYFVYLQDRDAFQVMLDGEVLTFEYYPHVVVEDKYNPYK